MAKIPEYEVSIDTEEALRALEELTEAVVRVNEAFGNMKVNIRKKSEDGTK